MTNVTSSHNLNVRRGPILKCENVDEACERLSSLPSSSFSYSKPVGQEVQALWKGLLRFMALQAHVQCLHLSDISL